MRFTIRRSMFITSVASLIVLTLLPTLSVAASFPVEVQLWAKRYEGSGRADDGAAAVAADPGGDRVFVTGWSIGVSTGYDYATIAYDSASGASLWTKRLDGPGHLNDQPSAIAVSPDGSTVYVTGWARRTQSDFDYTTIAYDAATGTRRWLHRYDGPAGSEDMARALVVSPDGSAVYVTGWSDRGGFNVDYTTIAYDASTGAQRWVSRYNGPGDASDFANAIGVTPDGSRVFVTGSSDGGSSLSDFATVSYGAAGGAQRWVRRYDGPGDFFDDAAALSVSPDGSRVFVTGNSTGVTDLFDFATIAYDAASGAQVWLKSYQGPGQSLDLPASVEASPDGTKVFVTGTSEGATTLGDFFTIAYEASSGVPLWAKRYDAPGASSDGANAMTVRPDGALVFVTGGSSSGDSDYATVAYATSNGHQVWVKRYDSKGADDDSASAIAVSADGLTVFVTGSSIGSGISDGDFATVAYVAG